LSYPNYFLVDTSFHVAYVVETEEQNPLAIKTFEYVRRNYERPRFVTTHTIFCETWNFIMHSENIRRKLDYRKRKELADYVCQEMMKYEVRMIPADMLGDIWNLYTSDRAKQLNLEYVDCTSIVYMRDIRKSGYDKNHQISIKGILSFNERHFNSKFAEEFGIKVFDFKPVLELMLK
jgi:predicted nucleic acid-binding protein